MTMPLPESLSGETILREQDQAVHLANSPLGIGYNANYGHLWLTNAHLVFKRGFSGAVMTYPLSHLTNASVVEKAVKLTSGKYSTGGDQRLVMVEFDNGGREHIHAGPEPDAWVQAILAAKAGAPALPYTAMPSTRSGVDGAGNWIIFVFIGIFACFFVGVGGAMLCLVLGLMAGGS